MLCWKISDGLVAGKLLFMGWGSLQIARGGATAVLSAMAEELRRPEANQPMVVEEPVYKRVIVSVRPTWRIKQGKKESTLVLPDAIELPVDLVHARTDAGLRICELAQLGKTFYFEEVAQLELLVPHFVREATMTATPESLLQHLLAPEPWMEQVRVRENDEEPKRRAKVWERLSSVADPVPGKGRPGILPAAAWERSKEVERLKGLLMRGVSALVIGEPRVGKSAVLYEAMREAARSKERTFWRTTAHRIVSGARYLGEWQQLCDKLVDEMEEAAGTLWVEDLVQMLLIGGASPQDSVAAYLRPSILSGKLVLVGELTPRSLEAARGRLPGFFDLFESVIIEEMSGPQVREVVALFGQHVEKQCGISLSSGAQQLGLRLAERHIPSERQPGKVLTFLAACATEAERTGKKELTEQDVLQTFVQRSGMPPVLLDDRQPLSRAELAAWLGKRIVGQPEAIDTVCRVVISFKAGLNDPARPVSTLLFAGPTGVGKTATARALAAWCFGQGQSSPPLIRIDMSELQHPAQLERLIGSATSPGELVRQVRERPFCVVLFDEIEKAHPVFFDTLLSVLDEGTMADSFGRVTDFRRSIIVMTTNLGSASGSSLGFGGGRITANLTDIKKHFRPEFFNRIDHIVRFLPLSEDGILQIARKELIELQERDGLKSRQIRLSFGEALVQRIAAAGFDPQWGARLLQRAVEQQVVAPLSRFLLDNPGIADAEILMDLEQGQVVLIHV